MSQTDPLPQIDVSMVDWEDFSRFLTVKRGYEDSTLRFTMIRMKRMREYFSANKLTLTRKSVEDYIYYLKHCGISQSTVNSYITLIKNIAYYLEDRGIESEDFATGVRHYAPDTKPQVVVSKAELDAILETRIEYKYFHGKDVSDLDKMYRLLILFLCMTGCRFKEARDLLVRNVDIVNHRVVFEYTKNKNNRTAWIAEPVLSEFKQRIEGKKPDDRVFTNSLGKPIFWHNFRLDLRNRCKQAGITKNVHPHSFRRFFASELNRMKGSLKDIQTLLGHKQVQTTISYIDSDDDQLRDTAFRNRMVRFGVPPETVLSLYTDHVLSFGIDKDDRFSSRMERTTNSLTIQVFIK